MRIWVGYRLGQHMWVSIPLSRRRRAAHRPLVGRVPAPVAHHVANAMVAAGLAGMLAFGPIFPPASAVALLAALAGLVMMVVQLPARMRRYRQDR